jgi:hypothetical protein
VARGLEALVHAAQGALAKNVVVAGLAYQPASSWASLRAAQAPAARRVETASMRSVYSASASRRSRAPAAS